MPGDGGGNLAPSTVDGYFEGWIENRKNGSDNTQGHITLQHELNNSTVSMAEKWLPQLQQTFNVVSVQECMNISQPYWETSWVYPTESNPSITNASTSSSASVSATGADGQSSTDAQSQDNTSMAAGQLVPSLQLFIFLMMALKFLRIF